MSKGQSPFRSVPLLLVMVTSVLVVVAAVIALATSTWQVVPVAVLLEVVLVVGLVIYMYWLMRPGPQGPRPAAEPTLHLGDEVAPARVTSALTATLRDAHAQTRGAQRFLAGCLRRLADAPSGEEARALRGIIEHQREVAGAHERLLDQRLRALGHEPSRLTDDEALVAAWLFERLLDPNCATSARHGFALAQLAATSYTIAEHLARTIGDSESEQVMARCRADAHGIVSAWEDSWEAVLELTERMTGVDPGGLTAELLEQAREMEEMRASLLTLASSHENAAGGVSGSEDAGLPRLLDLVDEERTATDDRLETLKRRIRDVGAEPLVSHPWETFAAARTTALIESIRSYKVIRDVRDVIAADHLASATYGLLEQAAIRSADRDTAELARRFSQREHGATERLEHSIDETLEVALIAE
jgi:ferritin-like metal-binding protein YciE